MSSDAFLPEDKNRRAVRQAVSLPAKMHVALSEESGGRLVTNVEITNLSPVGAGVRSQKITKEHVTLLVKKRRKCTLFCQLPDTEKTLSLKGEIIWLDLHAHNPPAGIYLGVALKDTIPAERKRLARFLENLSSRG